MIGAEYDWFPLVATPRVAQHVRVAALPDDLFRGEALLWHALPPLENGSYLTSPLDQFPGGRSVFSALRVSATGGDYD